MLLKDLLLEFEFNCQVRKLSPRTVGNYKKQIQYLLNFLEQEYSVTVLEEVEPTMIKRFLVTMTNLGRKPSCLLYTSLQLEAPPNTVLVHLDL